MLGGLFLAAMLVAWVVTRDRKYLRIATRGFQALVVVLVGFGLFYVFSRVLLL